MKKKILFKNSYFVLFYDIKNNNYNCITMYNNYLQTITSKLKNIFYIIKQNNYKYTQILFRYVFLANFGDDILMNSLTMRLKNLFACFASVFKKS